MKTTNPLEYTDLTAGHIAAGIKENFQSNGNMQT